MAILDILKAHLAPPTVLDSREFEEERGAYELNELTPDGPPFAVISQDNDDPTPPASIPADRRAHWSDLVASGLAEGITLGVCEGLATAAVLNEIEADARTPETRP